MNLFLKDLPVEIKNIQFKIQNIRKQNKLYLQNGDLGYASAPSNIALLKYWGKLTDRQQIPVNPSLSMTLGDFRSQSIVKVLGRFVPEKDLAKHPVRQHQLILNKVKQPLPEKMTKFLQAILYPFAKEIALQVTSNNNFPTACGIASSASGYAALVGAIADLLQLNKHLTEHELELWLSHWARLGSGSAARSAFFSSKSQFIAWSVSGLEGDISCIYPVVAHQNWQDIKHCVLILNEQKKEISSSDGHKLANSSPLQQIRVANTERLFPALIKAIAEFNFQEVAAITEEDAFAMHAVMQTGKTPTCYLNAEVAQVISKFIYYRNKHQLKAFWTLDAGPNVHLLFMSNELLKIKQFIQSLNPIKILYNSSHTGLILGRLNDLCRTEFKSTACGKTILAGEHAVLYGHTGIAIPLPDIQMHVSIHPSEYKESWLECWHLSNQNISLNHDQKEKLLQAFEKALQLMGQKKALSYFQPCTIRIQTDLPFGKGLGGSAALSFCFVKLADQILEKSSSIKDLIEYAKELDNFFHGGRSSGLDLITIAYSSILAYRKETGFQFIQNKRSFYLALIDSNRPKDTAIMIQNLADRLLEKPQKTQQLLEDINNIAEQTKNALTEGDFTSLKICLQKNSQCLKELELSCPEIDEILFTLNAMQHPDFLGAKLTGSGGGGFVLAVFTVKPTFLYNHFEKDRIFITRIEGNSFD